MSEEFKVVGFCVGLIIGYGFACAWFREYGKKNREEAPWRLKTRKVIITSIPMTVQLALAYASTKRLDDEYNLSRYS